MLGIARGSDSILQARQPTACCNYAEINKMLTGLTLTNH